VLEDIFVVFSPSVGLCFLRRELRGSASELTKLHVRGLLIGVDI
jgi:hypothetical protein